MREEDEGRPSALGEGLDDLSVAELTARIAALRNEIARLEAVKTSKQSAAVAATSVFKS